MKTSEGPNTSRGATASAALSIGVLVALAGGGALLSIAAWSSFVHFQPPPPLHADLPGGRALTSRGILVVLDGIRADVVSRMPFLSGQAERGTMGVTIAVQPSLSLPARASMMTGALPEIHGVTSNGRIFETVGETVLSLAKRADMPIAAAGWRFWAESLGYSLGQNVFVYRDTPDYDESLDALFAWQKSRCEYAVEFLSQWTRGLFIVSAVSPDLVAHRYGGRSTEYLQSAQNADACVQRVVEAFDDGNTTFIVSSDHGHIHRQGRGGHGGLESEVVNAPTILFGRAVRVGGGWRGRQIDIAPTISALLGLPIPASNQGRILWDAIEAPSSVRAELRRREEQQRTLARANLPRQARREGANRFPGVLVFVALAAAAAGWSGLPRPRSATWAALSIAVYYALYYVSFWVFGLDYSLSAVGEEAAAWWFVARNVAAVIPALIGSALVMAQASRNPLRNSLLGAALLVSATLVGHVAAIHWNYGLFMVRFLPDRSWFKKAHMDLMQLGVVGATAPSLFVLAAYIRTPSPAERPDSPGVD